MMNIYFFGIYNSQGGMENYALNLIRGMTQRYNDTHFTLLVFSDDFSNKDKLLNECGCNYRVLPNFRKHPSLFKREFQKLGKEVKPNDVLQLNICSFRNYFLFDAASKLPCKKCVVSHYSTIRGPSAIIHHINKLIFRHKFLNIAVSKEAGIFMFGKDFIVIPNGVDSKNFAFDPEGRNAVRKKYGIDSNVFLIGQVGRISEDKNQIFTIDLLSKLTKKSPNIKLMLVGKNCDEKILPYIRARNLTDNVVLTGPINKGLADYYSAFDCCVLPSKNEALSLALLESLSNGLPILYSDGSPEFALKGKVANIQNLRRLKLDLDLWAKNVEGLIETGKTARRNNIATTEYDLRAFIQSYYAVYQGN